MRKFTGVFAAMLTPFGDDPSLIDKGRIEKLVDFIIDGGVSGLFPLGTTGEGFYLPVIRRKEIAEVLINHVNRRVAVILQTGALSLDDTIELSMHAKETGADGIGVITPFFYRVDEAAIYDYYLSVANVVSPLPVFVYNLPSMTNNDVSPELLLRLAKKKDNIIGIKYSSDNLRQFREYRRKMGNGFSIFIGSDAMILPSFFEGGDGCVSGNASIYPGVVSSIYSAFKKGDLKKAADQQKLLDNLILVHRNGAHLSYFKTILRLRGIESGGVMKPLRETTLEEVTVIKHRLTELGLL